MRSVLAYSGPRPESEALPLQWWQVGERTITYRATKGGRLKSRQTRLLAPLAGDLAQFRIRCGRPDDQELVFGEWSGDDWDNWRERIFQPAAIAVGLPRDTIPATCAAASRACSSSRAATQRTCASPPHLRSASSP